jgi:hypothetical protein
MICHCPTALKVGDFFTKPLQGALFRKVRDMIMGQKHMDALATAPPMQIEERVRNTKQSGDGRHGEMKNTSTSTSVPKVTLVSWADLVRGVASTSSTEREARNANVDNRFRGVILSKQSSARGRV